MENIENSENKEFNSFYDEMMYEFKDMVEFLSYVFRRNKKTETDYIELMLAYAERPANDNWPIHDTETKKRNDEYAV